MPGIAAILTAHASPALEAQLMRMRSAMRESHDAEEGLLSAPELGVYAAWTAHADSFASRVSTGSAKADTGKLQVALVGECFGSDARDAAALARAFAHDGEAVVSRLNGLFAGLVVDCQRRQAWLFNDRYGSHRLYVFEKSGTVYVASEARALLAVLPELRSFDDKGVAHFLTFGSVLAGRTLFRGLQHLGGAVLWRINAAAAIERTRYFSPAQWESIPPLTTADYESRFGTVFLEAVGDQLHDAPRIGLSLTGGLDTRMILAAMPRSQRPAAAYTYAASRQTRLLDARIAAEAAGLVGLEHRVLALGDDFLRDFPRQLDRTVRSTDGCAGVLGAHEIWLSEQARAIAPLRLTGNYGSEILRSMSTFKRVGPDDAFMSKEAAAGVADAFTEFSREQTHPISHAAFAEVPWHLYGALAAARTQVGVRTPYLDNRVVELAYRAPGAAREGSAAALRFIQTQHPALAALPTDRGATADHRALAAPWRRLACAVTFKLDYWHKEGLPDALRAFSTPLNALGSIGVLGWHKFLAYRLWFMTPLATYAQQVVTDPRTRRMPFWNTDALTDLVPDHVAGRRNRLRELHAVLTLEAVQRTLLDADAWTDGDADAPPAHQARANMTTQARENHAWTR
jgi:asparagine synthase (glutamine-hydrolysing)